MSIAPRLEPDPFDKDVEQMLRDPVLLAELDEQPAKLDRGELKLYSNDEVRERLRKLGVVLVDDDVPTA